jgi:hypothetical protein
MGIKLNHQVKRMRDFSCALNVCLHAAQEGERLPVRWYWMLIGTGKGEDAKVKYARKCEKGLDR